MARHIIDIEIIGVLWSVGYPISLEELPANPLNSIVSLNLSRNTLRGLSVFFGREKFNKNYGKSKLLYIKGLVYVLITDALLFKED